MTVSNPQWQLINLASIETAKGSIFFATGRANLTRQDVISCGINFYYSVFHICTAILAITPQGTFLEKGIIEWKGRFNAPKYYLPCTHDKLIVEMNKIDSQLAKSLVELKELREYICYGPYLCSENTPHWRPIINTCEFPNVKQKLELFHSSFAFSRISRMISRYLKEKIQKSVFCLWTDQAMKIFKESIEINDSNYEESSKIWSTIREQICPKPLKNL